MNDAFREALAAAELKARELATLLRSLEQGETDPHWLDLWAQKRRVVEGIPTWCEGRRRQ